MNLKETVENYLEVEPRFRERANKDRGIVNLILKRNPAIKITPGECYITKELLILAVQDYNTLDRLWRKTLENNPQLRGSDYDEKDQLEAEHMAELGYRLARAIGPAEAVEKETQMSLL